MTFPQQKSIFTALFLAVSGFLLLEFIIPPLAISQGVVFAVGIVIGAIVIALQNDATPASVKTRTLYVGNLPYKANEMVVRKLFEEHSYVQSVRLLKDKHTGKRRGFGFVEVAEKDADKVITALNEKEFQQRTLKVREAKQKQEDTSSTEHSTTTE